MTNYSNVVPICIASEEHNRCNTFNPQYNILKKFPNGCLGCIKLYQNHDDNIIIDKIINMLNIN